MPLMTNAEAFLYDFGIYATELWSMTEAQFLEWLNAECDRERPADMVVRCKDCKYSDECHKSVQYTHRENPTTMMLGSVPVEYCSHGKRKDVRRVTVRRKKGYDEQVRKQEGHDKRNHL